MAKAEPGIAYTLTMDKEQLSETLKAVEFLMRMKLAQCNEIPFALLDAAQEDFCERRDGAKPLFEAAFAELFKGKPDTEWKDDEWHVLYDLYQVMRYARHEAEYPDSKGVDSYEPICTAGKPMATCQWREDYSNG